VFSKKRSRVYFFKNVFIRIYKKVDLSDGHVALDGVVSDEEVEYEAAVDAGEHTSRHHVDFFHLNISNLIFYFNFYSFNYYNRNTNHLLS
jgi:hypothetical protein